MSKKEVKLKASILDLVGPLLQQLKKEANNVDTETTLLETALREIVESIEKLKKCLGVREGWETQLIGYIGQIERQIDRWTSESDENNKKEIKRSNTSIVIELKNELNELVQKAYDVPSKDYKENNQKVKDEVEGEVGASSNIGENMGDDVGFKELIECMKELNPQLRDCLYSLGIFPVNEKLKKRLLIYWWIGLGLVPLQGSKNRTAEQYAEILFDDLMDQGILIPDQTKKLLHNQAVKWCTIQPTIHKQLIYACKRKGLIKIEERKEGTICFYGAGLANNNNSDAQVNSSALLNLKQQYLDSEDIKEVLAANNTLQVLQFGWWRYQSEVLEHSQGAKKNGTQETESKDHIEVDAIDFLKEVGGSVTYLSLRDISRVEEIPKNIGKLDNLLILDLRACHNLEKLPEKPKSKLGEILNPKLPKVVKSKLHEEKWFKNLNHLDMSECYLLDHMPKWLCELSNLEVLKGFVAGGKIGSKGQFCEIGDLSKLKKLRKLSIKMAKVSKDSINLKHLERLSVLTITWKLDDGTKAGTISFPENLEKLDIRCYPNSEATELSDQPASELGKLKRLYIRGGKLTKLIDPNAASAAAWTRSVEMLRLRSLKLLQLSLTDLSKTCTKLKCVEYPKCPELEGFPEDETCYIFPRPSANTQAINDEQQQFELQISRRPGKEAMTEQAEQTIHTTQHDKLLVGSSTTHQSEAVD